MSDLEALIKLLAVQLGKDSNFREALVETVLTFFEEEQQPAKAKGELSYLELFEQIEQQKLQLEKSGKYRLNAALNTLGQQIHAELRQAALALHQALRSKQAGLDKRLVQHVGVDLKNFPVGFPKDIDLLKLSNAYVHDLRDLHFLQQQVPEKLPELFHKITTHKQRIARWLQYVVCDALLTEEFSDTSLSNFRQTYLEFVQRLKTPAEHGLNEIFELSRKQPLIEVLKELEEWFYHFGILANQVIKELSPKYKNMLFTTLIHSRDCTILEALPLLELESRANAHFEILMTLRFGQAFQSSRLTWKTWFKQNLAQKTRREQALTFWKEQHPYNIPEFLFAFFETHHPVVLHRKGAFAVSNALNVRMHEEMGEVEFKEFLERRTSIMTDVERGWLEEENRKLPPPLPEPEFYEEEISLEEKHEIVPVQGIEKEPALSSSTLRQTQDTAPLTTDSGEGEVEKSPLATFVESAAETAVDAAIEGDLLEAALITAIDRGAEITGDRLTVTIEEEVEESVPKKPIVAEEPEESIWTEHIFPFIKQNLAFFLASNLIFVGLLLLVFTMWEQATWIRYGVAPLMVVGMSLFLSFMGLLLKKQQEMESDVPVAIIQTVAIFLAPMSLLFVALLTVDNELPLTIRITWGIILSIALLVAWSFVFTLSIKTVHHKMAGIHGYTLLGLNALLLLLPVAQLRLIALPAAGSPEIAGLTLAAKTLLVGGFYTGFLTLCWNMRNVLGRMLAKDVSSNRISMVFYSVTALGTFILVWGLTHAKLMILPQPYTYGPLLLLFSFLLSMIEFKILKIRSQTGTFAVQSQTGTFAVQSQTGTFAVQPVHTRITSLSYTAYFFIGLGVMLSIRHDYVRVVALLLAGLVWLYQAIKLSQLVSLRTPTSLSTERPGWKPAFPGEIRYFNISMVLLIAGFSSVALVRDFPAPFFPYLTLIVVLGLYLVSLIFPVKEVAQLAFSLSPIYLSFAFVISILWQWAEHIPPLSYGIAFASFGIFALYIGAKTDKLIHVHAGAFYTVAALPYLGTVDLNLYTLKGNTLVFGLALVGILWTMLSTKSPSPAIKDSRSTVLWNIAILGFCVMCLRIIFKDTFDFATNPFLQFQILSGPVIIAALMLLAGYFTRSYVAVYLALVILVIIFPEIKDRFNLPMYSGLGSTMSGIGFLTLAVVLGIVHPLRKARKVDLIWRKKTFPFQAGNHYLLFANPIVVAAFFLLTRTIFSTYPKNYFKPLMPFGMKTLIAVILCGTAYHFFSVWFKKRWFSYPVAYTGFIAICVAIIHSCFMDIGSSYFNKRYLPIFMLIAFLYCEGLRLVSSKIVVAENAMYIANPLKHLKYVVIWVAALLCYIFYSVYNEILGYKVTSSQGIFIVWLPLLFYLSVISFRLSWQAKHAKTSWISLLPAYLLFWQFVTLITTQGAYFPYVLESDSRFYFSAAFMVLGIVSTFFLFEHLLTKQKFRVLSPVLWISLVLLLIFSALLTITFYTAPSEFPYLLPQLIVWALVSFVIGRFLNLGPLWLWSAYLVHLLFLPSVEGLTNFNLSFHPFTLACIAIFLSVLSIITVKITWLSEYRYCYPWVKNRPLSPSFLFAVAAHLMVAFVFLQALSDNYRYAWMTIIGLFLAALPALFAAHQVGFSRHFLFGVPYALAWVGLTFAVKANFPANGWLIHLGAAQIISLGLSGALLTAVLSDYVLPCKDKTYHSLKFFVATSVILLIMLTYFSIRNIELLSWQWLVTSAMVSLGAGLYCRYDMFES